jgi:hypothetical protein
VPASTPVWLFSLLVLPAGAPAGFPQFSLECCLASVDFRNSGQIVTPRIGGAIHSAGKTIESF